MKRQNEEELQRFSRLARQRAEKGLLRKANKEKNKVRESQLRNIRKERYYAFTAPILSLEIPWDLSLDTNYDQVVNVVDSLRYISLTKRTRVGMDFTGVKQIGPAAALYLAAEIYRVRYVQAQKSRVTGRHPKDEMVSRLLSDMGFNNLLGINDPNDPTTSSSVEYIPLATSNDVKGELARDLRRAIEVGTKALDPSIKRAMYGGLTEAMTNVLHHAYPQDIHPATPVMNGRWWMAGSIDHERKEFMMLFYDQGVGIPVTVPRKHPVEKWGGLLSDLGLKFNDGNMIKAATRLGRTQTDEENRGRGLQDILEIVKVFGDGDLRILSNRGEYKYLNDESDSVKNHRRGIGGTLIQWRLSNP